MLCINNSFTDPYFNLASEEYILKNFREDCFMLWRSEPSVVGGKHQNIISEINPLFVKNNNIKVARRISGGGTVYHDPGNLNFTFITQGKEGHLINFRKFTQPVIDLLLTFGIKAGFEGKNDLKVNGLKFSGNAAHIWKNRTLHHGTILFSADLGKLSAALRSYPGKYTDKSVKSIRSQVTNIQSLLENKIDMPEFHNSIEHHILNAFPDTEQYNFSKEDIDQITRLRGEKFITWEWIYGYSPKYTFQNRISLKEGYIEVMMEVEKGIINEINFHSDILSLDITTLKNSLKGLRHDFEILEDLSAEAKISLTDLLF